jgi:hypothetical protein
LAPATVLLLFGGAVGTDAERKKELASFGTLRAPAPDSARNQALTWLRGVGKADETSLKSFHAIWDSDRALIDKVADTLVLGDVDAKKLLEEARDLAAPAPTAVPAVLKDAKRPAYYRANLALAYARALSGRRIFEEGLDALKTVKPEQVVDPSAYLFHKAVAEHRLLKAQDANLTIVRLLDDVIDAPERYKMVAALMVFDILTWKDKDLGEIARKMDNIERRLDLTRGGPITRKLQKEVIVRLDELIKEKENQAKSGGS